MVVNKSESGATTNMVVSDIHGHGVGITERMKVRRSIRSGIPKAEVKQGVGRPGGKRGEKIGRGEGMRVREV